MVYVIFMENVYSYHRFGFSVATVVAFERFETSLIDDGNELVLSRSVDKENESEREQAKLDFPTRIKSECDLI